MLKYCRLGKKTNKKIEIFYQKNIKIKRVQWWMQVSYKKINFTREKRGRQRLDLIQDYSMLVDLQIFKSHLTVRILKNFSQKQRLNLKVWKEI
jgi:hypothetical protein